MNGIIMNNANAINVRMLRQINQINELKGIVSALTLENGDLKDEINKLRNQLFEVRKSISSQNTSTLPESNSPAPKRLKEMVLCDQSINYFDDDDGFVRPSEPVLESVLPPIEESPPKIQPRNRSNSECPRPPPKPISLKSRRQSSEDFPVQNILHRYQSLPSVNGPPVGVDGHRCGILKSSKIEFGEKKRVQFSYS